MAEMYERVSGARMHAAYIRPGGVAQVTNNVLMLSLHRNSTYEALLDKDSIGILV